MNKNKNEILQICSIVVLFILLVVGGKLGVVAVITTLTLASLRLIDWKYLFYAGIVLSPVRTIAVTNIGFHLQISNVFLFSGICAALLDKNNHLVWKSNKFDVRIWVCLLVLVISTFQSRFIPLDSVVILGAFRNYPWIKSLTRVAFVGVLVGVAMFVRSYVNSTKRFEELIKVLIYAGLFHALLGIIGFSIYPFGFNNRLVVYDGDNYQRIKGFEQEPLFFGNYLLTVLPVVIMLATRKQHIINKKRAGIISCIIALGIVLTFSRGAWAGMFAAGVVVCAISLAGRLRSNNTRLLPTLFSIKSISIFFGSLFLLMVTILVIVEATNNSFYQLFIEPIIQAVDPHTGKFWSTRLRLMTIGIGLDALKDHPFSGIGYENFSFYAGNIFIHLLSEAVINYPDVNSFPFKLLIETGIVGFMVISLIVLKSVVDLFILISKTKKFTMKIVLCGYCATVVGLLVQLLFFSNILSVYLWVVFGAILGVVNQAKMNV